MIDHLWRDRIAIGTLVIGSGGPVHRLALLSAETELRARVVARRFRDRLRRGQGSGENSPTGTNGQEAIRAGLSAEARRAKAEGPTGMNGQEEIEP
jgi:hypothetical protein